MELEEHMRMSDFESLTDKVLYRFVFILAVMLPFGLIKPLMVVGPFEFTNVEIVIIVTGIVGVVHLVRVILAQHVRITLRNNRVSGLMFGAVFVFLLVAAISALAAPAYRTDALTFTFRVAGGILIFGLTAYVANTPQRVAALMWSLVVGAGLSALLGLGEAMHWSSLDRALLLFKEAPSHVGGIRRVSATFQYATIASMYYEMAIPVALVLAVRAANTPVHRALALICVLVCTVAVILTLTRSGMATLFVLGISLLGLALWRVRPLLLPSVLMVGTLLITFALLSSNTSAFRTRLLTEDDAGWYDAAYRVPDTLALEAGASTFVSVEVKNLGKVEWVTSGDRPYRLGFYWVSAEDDAPLDSPHQEVILPNAVSPGETVHLDVEIEPGLPPGEYRLMWGMLQRQTLWFRHRDVPEASTFVEILAGASAPTSVSAPQTTSSPPGGKMPGEATATVSRMDLWRAAVKMWREYPLLGVGPDNFRLLYGSYLGYEDWYRSNHANNLYLELLATTGTFGFVAFGGVVLILLSQLWTLFWRSAATPVDLWVIGLGGALLAFFVHGVFDYFLSFLPTLGYFWMVAGLITALHAHSTFNPHAPERDSR